MHRLVKFVRENQIDLTVVGPEAPLVAGLTDELHRHGLAVFGPSAAAARLEGSKVFTKKLLKRANIPTATFSVFSRVPEAMQYLDDCEEQPLVVKADGLAAGKGVSSVQIWQNEDSGRGDSTDGAFGEAGSQVVIEECLVGQEASILAIVDGDTIVAGCRSGSQEPTTMISQPGGMEACALRRLPLPRSSTNRASNSDPDSPS